MTTFNLPQNYKLKKEIDLQKDKKLMILVNVGAILISVPLLIIGMLINPIEISIENIGISLLLKPLIAIVGIIIYTVLHELVHGFFIKCYCGEKAEYGFTGLYAFAGKKTAYFAKKDYLIIALSPVVILGIVLLILNFIVPSDWFWVVYVIQIVNLSGASGDFYVEYLLSKTSQDVLVNDAGVSMKVYEPESL